MKKFLTFIFLISLSGVLGIYFYSHFFKVKPDIKNKNQPIFQIKSKKRFYPKGELSKPRLTFSQINYSFFPQTYENLGYSLPLNKLPENYQRDIEEKFGKKLTQKQKEILLKNGVLILPQKKYESFEDAFSFLKRKNIPIFITSDSILNLIYVEFDEILKHLENEKLSLMLKAFLEGTIREALIQYESFQDSQLKELAGKNLAYLSVAMKLLEPDYEIPKFVSKEVTKELERIQQHEGFFKSEIFSLDCPKECLKLAFPQERCSQQIKDKKVFYQGKLWDSLSFYKEICTKKCYCEDYSQYLPIGHYTSSEKLKRYFKAMTWLSRMTFKIRGENWTKQAILLSDVVKSAKVKFEDKEYPAYEIWLKLYTINGFFSGNLDDLTFYDYDLAIKNVFGYGFDEEEILKRASIKDLQNEILKLKGSKILEGIEIDLSGNLKDLTQGLRLFGQKYNLHSQILENLVYKNVGPNLDSPYYEEVLDFCIATNICSQKREFYYSCENMEKEKTKYWNEICFTAVRYFCERSCSETTSLERIKKLYSVCRLLPSNLDIAYVLGSEKAQEILDKYFVTDYCDYKNKVKELKNSVNFFTPKEWTKNLYNSWLWLIQPLLKEKPQGYPNWMESEIWKLKELITALASFAQLRHDTILDVKQDYSWTGRLKNIDGYVEPNPGLFARGKYLVDFLKEILKEKDLLTFKTEFALEKTSEMLEKLKEISEKELEGKDLTEKDYDYIKNIPSTFNSILESLAVDLKKESFKSQLVQNIYTDSNTKRVLKSGIGKIDWVLVIHKSKKEKMRIAVGPIFSYYEFLWPTKDRLTDEKWEKEVLEKMQRFIFYSEANIESAKSPYIGK